MQQQEQKEKQDQKEQKEQQDQKEQKEKQDQKEQKEQQDQQEQHEQPNSEECVADSASPSDNYVKETDLPGHVNNLTAIQRRDLFYLWYKLFDLEDMYGNATGGVLPNGERVPVVANAALSSSTPNLSNESFFENDVDKMSLSSTCDDESGEEQQQQQRQEANKSKSPPASRSPRNKPAQKNPSPTGSAHASQSQPPDSTTSDGPADIVAPTPATTSMPNERERTPASFDSGDDSRHGACRATPSSNNEPSSPTFWTHYTESDALSCKNECSQGTSPSMSTVKRSAVRTSYSEELWRGLFVGCMDPDSMLLRYLRARKWNAPLATNMLINAVNWRATTGVLDLTLRGEAAINLQLLQSGKTFFHAYDKKGRLVIYVVVRRHEKNAQTAEEGQWFTIYQMEIARRLMSPGTETVTLVFDLTDFTMASMDFPGLRFLVNCFQSYYPESLGQCLIVNAPWLFWGCWKVIKYWLDPVVTAKVIFVKKEEINNYIDETVLLKDYFGKNQYEYDYIPRQPGEDHIQDPDEMQELKETFMETRDSLIALTKTIADKLSEIDDRSVGNSPTSQSPSSNSSSRSCSPSIGPLDAFWQSEDTQKLMKDRDNVKQTMVSLATKLDARLLPKNYYHRLGVMDNLDDSVDWSKAIQTSQ